MKKIKLAVLAGALVLSAAGGYANYKMRSQYYYIVPNTPINADFFEVASQEPSGSCNTVGFSRVCVVLAADGYQIEDLIPTSQCTITSTYP
jgi:hypothetical protein